MSSTPDTPLPPFAYDSLINQALTEDIGKGDQTTQLLFPEAVKAQARIIAREDLVVAGLFLVPEAFHRLDAGIQVDCPVNEGQWVRTGTVLAQLTGDGRSILKGERVALNFLQHFSGIATFTARFVEAVKGTKAAILDTRKTTPGLRALEKYAVRMGGGQNHRMDLSGGILIKDNHIALTGSLKEAVYRVKKKAPSGFRVEVEAANLKEVKEALSAEADVILLDNMPISHIKEAVKWIEGRALTEASGGMNLSNVREIASLGVDFISIGALTHSAQAVDISMDIVAVG